MPPDFSRDVYCLLGLPFDAVDLAEAESHIRQSVEHRTPCFLSTPNLNFLIASQTDAAFRDSVINSDLSVADGMPIVWLCRLLGIPIHERVAGSTLFEKLRQDSGKKISVYFFGGLDGVAESACKQLNNENKGISCVGFESPGFGDIEDMSADALIQRINDSKADFLVVALGARKGQAWIERNRSRLNTPVISHLGAVLNFVAGTVNRAPTWVQKIGCEWLWRIKEEPAIWKRYAQDGFHLMALMATIVVPYALFLRRHKQKFKKSDAAIAAAETTEDSFILRLSGSWTKDNLQLLREHFRNATRNGKNIMIDMGEVTYIDSAFVGLLMLVKAAQSKCQKKMKIIKLQETTHRILHYCRAGQLLEI